MRKSESIDKPITATTGRGFISWTLKSLDRPQFSRIVLNRRSGDNAASSDNLILKSETDFASDQEGTDGLFAGGLCGLGVVGRGTDGHARLLQRFLYALPRDGSHGPGIDRQGLSGPTYQPRQEPRAGCQVRRAENPVLRHDR